MMVQGVTGAKPETIGSVSDKAESKSDKVDSSAFDTFMRSIVSPTAGSEINEEELYGALLQERVTKLKGDEAGKKFSELFTGEVNAWRRADGVDRVEDAANSAVDKAVAEGLMTEEEAGTIKEQAFKAAQLDSNVTALYDGRGSENDPTIAKAALEVALLGARGIIERFDAGEDVSLDPAADGTSDDASGSTDVSVSGSPIKGTAADGAEGFLWKPVSESDGNLVILLPSKYTSNVESVLIKSLEGEKIEDGRNTSVGNGNREHFRFSKPGGEYDGPIVVEAKLKDGTVIEYQIDTPGSRVD